MNFTLDNLKEAMSDFYGQKPAEERQFFVHTGTGGMKLFSEALKGEALRQRRLAAEQSILNLWIPIGVITEEEKNNLYKMIDSPDLENLVMVESIIEEYEQRRISTPVIP